MKDLSIDIYVLVRRCTETSVEDTYKGKIVINNNKINIGVIADAISCHCGIFRLLTRTVFSVN